MDCILDDVVYADGMSEGLPPPATGAATYLVLLVREGIQQGNACNGHLTADHEVLQGFAILRVTDLAH
jgi:hypothetical protein